jgi:hypothetical protein
MRPVAHHLPNGIVQFEVVNGLQSILSLIMDVFSVVRGLSRIRQRGFRDQGFGYRLGMVQGELNMFAAVGNCDLKLKGFIPLLDGINPLIDRIPFYLGP